MSRPPRPRTPTSSPPLNAPGRPWTPRRARRQQKQQRARGLLLQWKRKAGRRRRHRECRRKEELEHVRTHLDDDKSDYGVLIKKK